MPFFHDPADVGDLVSGSSAFSKTSLNIRKFTVLHIKAAVDKKTEWSLLSRSLDYSGELSSKERRKQIANIYTFGGKNTL